MIRDGDYRQVCRKTQIPWEQVDQACCQGKCLPEKKWPAIRDKIEKLKYQQA
jgi:hypothetical protein